MKEAGRNTPLTALSTCGIGFIRREAIIIRILMVRGLVEMVVDEKYFNAAFFAICATAARQCNRICGTMVL
jgi:hypothetical protein